MRSLMIPLLLTCFLPAPAFGQEAAEGEDRSPGRLSVQVRLGRAVGGPARGLSEQMRRADFDDIFPAGCLGGFFCGGEGHYPIESAPQEAVGMDVRWDVNGELAMAGGVARAPLGGSSGYRSSGPGYHLRSHWISRLAWGGVLWTSGPFRVGGGPALYRLHERSSGTDLSRVGLLGDAALEWPAGRTLFLDAAVRGHLIPAKTVAHRAEDGSRETTIPVGLRPDWSHVTVTVGVGLRP